MKITLVDNFIVTDPENINTLDLHPHLGLLSLMTIAENAGHSVEIYDPKFELFKGRICYDSGIYESVALNLLASIPDLIGFTTLGCSFIFTLRVAEKLKELSPSTKIILGGPHATILDKKLLTKFHCFDLIVRNETEKTFLEVLDVLHSGNFDGIEGVTWRHMDVIQSSSGAPQIKDLDALPKLNYGNSLISERGLTFLRVDAGRGCPFSCTFCSTASFFGRLFRIKSCNKIVQELDELHLQFGISKFTLNHDLFTVNRVKVVEFCEAVMDRGYEWSVSARIDCVDIELLTLMHTAGCRAIYYGIETGSPRMQLVSQKKLDLRLFDPIIDFSIHLGMTTIVSFITGYPEEAQADLDLTLEMIGSCFLKKSDKLSTQLHMLTPEPGTALFYKHKDSLLYDEYLSDFNVNTLDSLDEQYVLDNPEIFASYYYYPTLIDRKQLIGVVETYRALREYGKPLVAYSLLFFNNCMSSLVRNIVQYGADQEVKISKAVVLDFIGHSLGLEHHLYSLYRYEDMRYSLVESKKADSDFPNLNQQTTDVLAIAHNVRIFHGMHNCVEVTKKINNYQSKSILSTTDVGTPSYYLYRTDRDEGNIFCYQIDEITYDVLKVFKNPMSLSNLRSTFEDSAELVHLFQDESIQPLLDEQMLIRL